MGVRRWTNQIPSRSNLYAADQAIVVVAAVADEKDFDRIVGRSFRIGRM